MSVEFATFEDMLESVQGLPAMPIAVIDADERHVLEGACEAAAAGYVDPILIGDEPDDSKYTRDHPLHQAASYCPRPGR